MYEALDKGLSTPGVSRRAQMWSLLCTLHFLSSKTLPTCLRPSSGGARAWVAMTSISLGAMSPPCQDKNQRWARQYSAAQSAVGSSVSRSRNT